MYPIVAPQFASYGDESNALAEQSLFLLDMSEFMTPDAALRLIRGSDRADGLLTRRVREQPFCVVLLDEIEKAHPSVLSLLLQLFEDGRLTDAAGKTAHFQHTVVVMTSNLGARSRVAVGFGDTGAAVLHDIARAVREYFPPELFNRIDRIVPFRPLTADIAVRVAEKELDRLCRRRGLVERSIFVQPAAGVTERIARVAFVAADGARSVKRFVEDTLGALITEAIAGERPAALQILRISTSGEGFHLQRDALVEFAALVVAGGISFRIAGMMGRYSWRGEACAPGTVRRSIKGLGVALGLIVVAGGIEAYLTPWCAEMVQ